MTLNKTSTVLLADGTEVDVYYSIEIPSNCTDVDEIEITHEYDEAGLTEDQIIGLEDIIADNITQHRLDIIEG